MLEPDEDRIRLRAFEMSERAGHPAGRDEEFWHAARLELQAQDQAEELVQTFPDIAVRKRA